MSALLRSAFALLALFGALLAPLHAFTVEEMKAMEGKVKALVTKNMPSVVSLIGEKSRGAGSGTIVSADGVILTAAHVSQGNDEMIVVFPDGKSTRCKVLGANYTRDVSLCKIIEPGTYPFVEIGDSDKLELATIVVALGHPGGYDVRRTPPVRIGRIGTKNLGGFLVSDCTLISGDSGGPLFDLEGKLIGVHSSISADLSFNRDAPVSAAKADWNKLLAGEQWGRLNAGPGEFVPNREKAVIGGALDGESTNGVSLLEVYPKSPLDVAGLKKDDVITSAGGQPVKTADDLVARLGKSKPGDKLELGYRRGGDEQKAQVSLISRTEMNKLQGIEERPRRGGRRGPPEPAPDAPKPDSSLPPKP
jgi:serine protease Do